MTTTASPLGVRLAVATLGIMAAALRSPSLVLAHSELDVPTPADGATVDGSPETVEGTFTEPLDPDASLLELRDAAGIALLDGGVDPDDDQRMVIDPVPELAPGTYTVQWHAVAIDGHIERDIWPFEVVVAPTPEPTPTQEPSDTAEPTASPSPTEAPSLTQAPTPAASPDPGDPTGDGTNVILPIVIGLAIVAAVAVVLVRRQGRTPVG